MKKIGKYEIRGLLGKGGMGKVYKVALPVVGRIVALKLLDPNPFLVELIGDKKIRDLFVSEAVTIAGLRHPNIVEILDFDENSGKPYYTMDFYCNNLGDIIGETYRTDAPSRIIPIERAIAYIRQTLKGLACLHHSGIIHRDIKPFNLLLTDQDRVKICDFGLSKLRGEAFGGPASLKVGSPWYASPEQEEAPDSVDYSADTFSVGIILYRMLCGVLPEHREKPASAINPDLDAGWDRFLEKAIAEEPRERFSTARQMLNALEAQAAAWSEKKENICEMPLEFLDPPAPSLARKIRARKTPIKVRPGHARERFGASRLWRPAEYVQNDFSVDKENGIVTDHATGLVWEWSGSPYPGDYSHSRAHIDRLNHLGLSGRTRWRLPTIDELMTLLRDTPHGGDHCLEPAFDQTRQRLWSADRRSFTAAWFVNMDLGYVACQDLSAAYYVKGVCDL